MESTLNVPAPPRPPGDIADLPAGLRPGDAGVFSGDWFAYDHDGGTRYAAAFAGTLVSRVTGWAVWECTQAVAQDILGEQERMRWTEYERLRADGMPAETAKARVDAGLAVLSWDGPVLVVEETRLGGTVTRIAPDERGMYVVMGGVWCWTEVPAHLVDVIHGDGSRVSWNDLGEDAKRALEGVVGPVADGTPCGG